MKHSSKSIGNSFEEQIMWLERICRNKGIAAWEKIEAPAKQVIK